MPLHIFSCKECEHKQEHFVYSWKDVKPLNCPECSSENYEKQKFNSFRTDIWYSDMKRTAETKITPHINEIYSKIGKEAANQDMKTAENIFGEEKVGKTFVKHDEA